MVNHGKGYMIERGKIIAYETLKL